MRVPEIGESGETDGLPPATYGGEVEALVVDSSGCLTPVRPELKDEAARAISEQAGRCGGLDLHGDPATVDWDITMSTPELNLGVHGSLSGVVGSALLSASTLNRTLHGQGLSLIASAYHPSCTEHQAYRHVTDKPVYLLFRGTSQGPVTDVSEGERAMISAAWPDDPGRGRGFDHRAQTLSAGIHVWTRTEPESAGAHLALISALGWMVNLITANGPLRQGQRAARDTRVTTWKRFLAPSRYSRDLALSGPLPERPRGLADYLSWVLSFRPLAVRDLAAVGGRAWDHPLAVIAPAEAGPDWNMLDFLELDRCQAVGPDGRIHWIEPHFAHLCNGGDWFYWPATGGRLRILAPGSDQVVAREFARAVRDRDDHAIAEMLGRAGIRDSGAGALCIEGRAAATVLPCRLWSDWGCAVTAIPFALQVAVSRAHEEVWQLLAATGLSWSQLTSDLPRLTNRPDGFHARIGNVVARDLAREIWRTASGHLNSAERRLVGDTVEEILDSGKAPAERQLDFLMNEIRDGRSEQEAIAALLEALRVPPDIGAGTRISGQAG